jgi:hypothetical protein
MWRVARGKRRERQIIDLRLAATEQIHRAALVRYLRDSEVTGRERILVLREFYGALDTHCAILAEHRSYMQAVSSQVCALDLLTLSNDRMGVRLIKAYEREYALSFAMDRDRTRALNDGRPYILGHLLPEIKESAVKLRRRILSGEHLPPYTFLLPRSARLPVADEPFERNVGISRR